MTTRRIDGGAPRSSRRTLRATTALAMLLAAVWAVLAVALAYRLELTWEVSIGQVRVVSARTRDVLADTQGTIKTACFMDRRHPMFRPVSRLLRGLRQASRSVAGAEIALEYVDPRWDLARAAQLAAWGVPENAVVFERQRRRLVVTLDEMIAKPQPVRRDGEAPARDTGGGTGVFRGERVCAAAIARLALPFERAVVYWLQGHGEARPDDYDELRGFSDITRALRRDGFELRPLTLPGLEQLPADGQVVVSAGARQVMSAEERRLIEAYLERGGRLLVLLEPRVPNGLEPLLEAWGIRVTPFVAVSPKTLSGQDVVVSTFADHGVARNLQNAAVVFGFPACLEVLPQTAQADADRPQVTLLASTDRDGWGESQPDVFPRHFDPQSELRGPVSVAAVAERGARMSRDVALKPTRICVFGETGFVSNGALASRANANRDLFMNAVAWLAGIDTGTASSLGGDAALVTGFARREWVALMVWAAAAVPGLFLAVFVAVALRARR